MVSAPKRSSTYAERVAFISDLYKGVLKRDADPQGLAQNIEALGEDPSFEEARVFLSAFANGAEAQTVLALHGIPKVTSDPFKHVISLGSHCLTSSTLKKIGLKSWSGPMDWIFSNINMTKHCIDDNFKTFMEKTHHKQVDDADKIYKNANKCEHRYYKDNFDVNFMFNHYDITNDDVFRYYERCIQRFKQAVYGEERSLLVCITGAASEAEFLALCESIDRYENAVLLVVRVVHRGWQDFGLSLVSRQGRHILCELKMIGEMGPTFFTHFQDEVAVRAFLGEMISSYHE